VAAAQQRLAVSSQPFAEALNLSLQPFDQARSQALVATSAAAAIDP
jgi:hypothetical protein